MLAQLLDLKLAAAALKSELLARRFIGAIAPERERNIIRISRGCPPDSPKAADEQFQVGAASPIRAVRIKDNALVRCFESAPGWGLPCLS